MKDAESVPAAGSPNAYQVRRADAVRFVFKQGKKEMTKRR